MITKNKLKKRRNRSSASSELTKNSYIFQDLRNLDGHVSAPSPNPYRDLVEKYEALLEVHNTSFTRQRQVETTPISYTRDDLTSGDFSSINIKELENERVKEVTVATGAKRKICLRTPTDFSEAETSSSGFSDETSNKCTQTDETFLCSIGDGEDKFSIYDEAQPMDARFRHCPKYRELFKEIFGTLKKAAENKEEGEKLPLLDDTNPPFKVPPVTPAVEELPCFPDETESIISSVVSEQSVAMSECVTKHERKTVLQMAKKNAAGPENHLPSGKQILDDGRVPHRREPEYLAFNAANLRKKHRRRGRHANIDPSDSPVLPSSPRVIYTSGGRRRRDRSASQNGPAQAQPINTNASTAAAPIWNGNSITIYNRNTQSPHLTGRKHRDRHHGREEGESQNSESTVSVYRRTSTAAHDLQKLIKLDLSYAEVLRRADQTKNRRK